MRRRGQSIFSYNKHADEITEDACVSKRTLCRIMDEGEDVELGSSVSLSTPSKPRQNNNKDSYDNGEAVLRRISNSLRNKDRH
jgi:hypothetical protein